MTFKLSGPLTVAATKRIVASAATVSIRMVWPFMAVARDYGVDVGRLAARLGVTAAQLQDPDTRVPTQQAAELLCDAVAYTGERDIGLLAGSWVDAAHLGIGEYIARSQPTLRAAMEVTGRYLPLLVSGISHFIEDCGDYTIARVKFSPQLLLHEAAYEFAVAVGVLRTRRMMRNDDLSPLAVHFAHSRPASTARHEALFRCPLHFDAEVTQVVMPSAMLEMRMPSAEPALAELLARQADAMLERLPHLTSSVQGMLAGEVELRNLSVERAAKRLGMSVRTLARRLAAEGTSFRALVEDARKLAAMRDLARDVKPIHRIAEEVGFSSGPSFHRAFKRWTGTTANNYRQKMRGRQP